MRSFKKIKPFFRSVPRSKMSLCLLSSSCSSRKLAWQFYYWALAVVLKTTWSALHWKYSESKFWAPPKKADGDCRFCWFCYFKSLLFYDRFKCGLYFIGLEFWLTDGLIDGLIVGLIEGLWTETRGEVAFAFEKLLDMLAFCRRTGLLIWGGL